MTRLYVEKPNSDRTVWRNFVNLRYLSTPEFGVSFSIMVLLSISARR